MMTRVFSTTIAGTAT